MSEAPKDRRDMSLMAKLFLPEAEAPPWSMVSAWLSVGAMLISLILVGPALATILLGSDAVTPFLLMLSWALGMALTAAFALVARRSSEQSRRALRLVRGELPLALSLLCGIGIALALDLTVSLASGQFLPAPQIWGFQSQGGMGLLLATLMLVVLQPLAETLVFQAVLLPRLRWSFGHWGGVIATSAAFTLLHLLVFTQAYGSTYDPMWYGLVYPAGIGLMFCLLRVYTRSSGAVLVARMGAGLVFLLTALVLFGG